MITKNFSQLFRHDIGVVIRSVAVGRVKDKPYIAAGCIDSNLYIYDNKCIPVQKVTFGNWVRCCAMGDLDGDGDAEIIAGAGDKTVKVLKFIGDSFHELRTLNFPHIINACAIADINGDGCVEIIIGTWGSEVIVLNSQNYAPIWTKKFQGWINCIVPGDITWSGRTDMLIGTREGQFSVVEGADGHTIWDYKFSKEINAAAVADVDNSGAPSILVGGDFNMLTIFNSQGNLQREIPLTGRVISIAVGDIDGDKSNEIILGCGDNTLRVLENQTHTVDGITQKWRGSFENTIRGIQIVDLDCDGVNDIVFGGYNKILQAVKDFRWGEKPAMEVSSVPIAATPLEEPMVFEWEKIDHIEDILGPSSEDISTQQPEQSFAESPARNFGEFPEKIGSPYDLLDHIITPEEFNAAEIARHSTHVPSKLVAPPIAEPKQEVPSVPSTIQVPPTPTAVEQPPISQNDNEQYCNKAVGFLKNAGVISSKVKLIESIKTAGVPESIAEEVVTKLLADQRITYSRTAPRGYSITGEIPTTNVQGTIPAPIALAPRKKAAKRAKPQKRVTAAVTSLGTSAPVSLPAASIVPTIPGDISGKAIDSLKNAGIISSKAGIFALWAQAGISDTLHEQLLENLRSASKIEYHKTSPRGYQLIDVNSQPFMQPKVQPVSEPDVNLTAAIDSAYAAIKTKGRVTSKPELVKVLEECGISPNLIESIINNLKESGKLQYSRSAPRGYFAV